jgi:hypothetical protein
LYSKLWSKTLRQGDVCGPILYPKFKSPPQQVLRPQGWAADAAVNDTLELPADSRRVVVVSHCCEFNETKRAQFLVARIQDFAPNLSPADRAAIRAANDAIRKSEDDESEGLESQDDESEGDETDDGKRYDYIDTFVLEPIPNCFAEPQLVSFTTIMALPIAMASNIKALKHAELEHEHREKLRNKLGFFLGRKGDDVDESEKVPPTRPSPSPPED